MEERQARDAELVEKMNIVLVKLEALLKEWTFGDSLLVKMVAIHAFSIEWTQSKTLARAFMLQFGAASGRTIGMRSKKGTGEEIVVATIAHAIGIAQRLRLYVES